MAQRALNVATLLIAVILSAPAGAFSITETTRSAMAQYQYSLASPPLLERSDTEVVAGPPTPTSVEARAESASSAPGQLKDPRDSVFPLDSGFARAVAGPGGYSNVLVAGETLSSGLDDQRLYAEVHQSLRATVPSASGYYVIYYSFELFDMYIDVWDGYGLDRDANEYVRAKIGYELWWEGSPLVWTWQQSVIVGENGDISGLTQLGDWGGAGYTETVGPNGRLRVDYDPLVQTDFVVGSLLNAGGEDHAEFELHSRLYAELNLPAGLDLGAEAGISDPFDLSHAGPGGSLRVEFVQGNPVPLPAAFWLLPSALLALTLSVRRNRC